MELQVQELASPLKKDGADSANQEAAAILDNARKQAAAIVADAKAEADKLRSDAKAEIEVFKNSARLDGDTLILSGRDTQEQDAVTGALSRNHYERDMASEVFQGGVALVDVDDLKLYNDIYGHAAGDRVLWTLAETIRRELGDRGSLVRYGGDEFLVLAPGAEEAGARVTQAQDGREAVQAFADSAQWELDAILIDMMMPVMDGLEATRAIRSMRRCDSDIPILAMTANLFDEDVAACLEAGMDGHVPKPLNAAQMIRAIAECIGRKRP